ncbi:MAG: Serine/threonine-protein kinase RIO1 [Candidatus Alkanophagales archaeon MCA70_species_1]|nr:Serine/threonine-protein kinase RIO1 [Candidatus Alkanophaga volatiphilum]
MEIHEAASSMAGEEGLLEVEEWLERERRRARTRRKTREDRKVEEYVFDIPTLECLYKLAQRRIITAMGGPVSTGKEAFVFHALSDESVTGMKEIAVKIYKVETSTFDAMHEYIIGDPRFEKIRRDKRSMVFAWTKKEFRNLKRAFDAGVRVPNPIAADRNVLVMEFIGVDGVPEPLLREVANDLDDVERIFKDVVSYMRRLYNDARLVHADLSEFNIMAEGYIAGDKIRPVFIDMGQAVLLSHPNAETFLRRDVRNVVTFFRKLGLECSEDEILEMVRNGGRKGAERE